MRRVRAVLLALLVLAASLAHAPAVRAAEDLRIIDLRVSGGSGWQPTSRFRLDWDRAEGASAPVAAYFRLYDSSGAALGPPSRREELDRIDRIEVPAPGVYRVEAWVEGASGETGPPASAVLRFDDVPPATAVPKAAQPWFAGDEPVTVALSHPSLPLPLSGIRGYAVSVDRGEGSDPCPTHATCSAEETDLPGGIDDDRITLGPLPEGVNYVRAAAVSGSGVRSHQVESAAVLVDATRPRVELLGQPGGWSRGPVELTALASDPLSGMAADGPAGPFTAIVVDGGAPSRAEGGIVSALVDGEGVHEVAFYARDAAGNVADAGPGAPAPPTARVRIDQTPPRVSFAAAQDPADPERIEALVSDGLSGPSPARGEIAVRPSHSHSGFQALPTTAAGGRLVAHWDSDSYPPGNYEFLATGYDLAGNTASGSRRASGARMVLSNPLKRRVSVESGFGGERMRWRTCRRARAGRRCHRREIRGFESRPRRIAVPFGRGVRFGGRLLGEGGLPVAGAEVLVTEKFETGAEPALRTSVVRSDDRGRFSLRLGPGPSREIWASFGGSAQLSRASGGRVRLDVLSGVRLRASAASARIGGAPVLFGGRVLSLGSRIPAGGRPVELQFRYPGAGWSEFRTVQTDARGRFAYPYSFTDDDSRGVRFQFRAFVPPLPGWPYEPAASQPVSVSGR